MADLTADQKDLLALCVRTADDVAIREHCRTLHLVPEKHDDAAVGRYVQRLRARPDAKLYMAQQQRELERNRIDAMKDADNAGWEREKARAELERSTYELAQRAATHQLTLIDLAEAPDSKVKAPSGSSMAKLIDICRVLSGQSGGGRTKTAQERRDLLRTAGLLADEPAAVPVAVVKPPVPKLPEGIA